MSREHSAGKGDSYRKVDKKQYDKNFDSINWGKKKPDEKNNSIKNRK